MKIYVGITNNTAKRWREHRQEARKGSLGALYNALRAYPDAAFVVVERGSREHVSRREAELIAELGRQMSYNRAPGGCGNGMLGMSHTESTKVKMSNSAKGRKQTPEHIANLSAVRLGKKRSEESRARMSAGQKKRIRTDAEIQRIRVAAVGRVVSDEHRAKLKAAALARWARHHETIE